MFTVTIYRFDEFGTKEIHDKDKFDTETEANLFAYRNPFVFAEHQYEMLEREGRFLIGDAVSGYYAEIR
jgi:hypothetical protein